MHAFNGTFRIGLDRIGHANEARCFAVHRDKHRRLGLLSQVTGLGLQCGNIDVFIVHQFSVTQQQRFASKLSFDAVTNDSVELFDLLQFDVFVFRRRYDRFCKWMFRRLFYTRTPLQ